MGFIKDIELDTGVVASYHMVKSISVNFDVSRGKETIVTIGIYLNKDSRLNNKVCLGTREFIIVPVDSISEAYDQLKKIDDFSQYEDDL
jgi:hypothetical protein